MDHAKNKARRRVITIFMIYLCIALMFFGLFAYIVTVKRAEGNVSDRTVTLSKIFVLAGIFSL